MYERNKAIRELLAEKKLNFCELLTPPQGQKLSVTGELYKRPGFVGIHADGEVVRKMEGDYYYGASPLLSTSLLLEIVASQSFYDKDSLNQYVHKKGYLFTFPEEKSKYIKAIAAHILVHLSCLFGIRIKKGEISDALFQSYKPFFITEDNDPTLDFYYVRGCLPKTLWNTLSKYTYNKEIIIKEGKSIPVWSITESDTTLADIYQQKDSVELLWGNVFYSGTLLRTLKLEVHDTRIENSKIIPISLTFEPSSYGTVSALDNAEINHPFLEDYYPLLEEFFDEDDLAKENMVNSLEAEKPDKIEASLAIINAYLDHSNNVNQIGVSGNLLTSDEYLIMANRARKSIDEGNFYPGVNGNCELKDHLVEFYKHSIYEDYPTIHRTEERIDFFGELQREAVAELGIKLQEHNFECVGITLSGDLPNLSPKKRMHFNICFQVHTNESLEGVQERQREATEAFESTFLFGYAIRSYKNRWQHFGQINKRFLMGLVESRDVLEAVLGIYISCASFRSISNVHLSFSSFGNLFFPVLITLLTLSKLWALGKDWYNKKKITRKSTFYRQDSEARLIKSIKNFFQDEKKDYHPVALALLWMYIEQKMRGYKNVE